MSYEISGNSYDLEISFAISDFFFTIEWFYLITFDLIAFLFQFDYKSNLGHTAVAYDSKVYIFGGRNDEMVSFASIILTWQ